MLKIIHISDLHLENEDVPIGKLELITALANELEQHVDEDTILCFTGDLINFGGSEFKDKDNAFNVFEEVFINKILEENELLRGRIFVIPGNHDIDREAIDEFSDDGLISKLTETEILDRFISDNREESSHLDRISRYNEWAKTFYKNHNGIDVSNFDNSVEVQLKNYTVGIAMLNSVWLSKDDDDEGRLLIGKSQIDNSLSVIDKAEIKIALSHHPLEFLAKYDKDQLKKLTYRKFDFLLTGHVHELGSNYTQDLNGSIFISIANSSIGDYPEKRKHVNGFTVIEYKPNEIIRAKYKKYVEDQEVFVPNTDIGTQDGCKEFVLLDQQHLIDFNKNLDIVLTIENANVERLNRDIILSNRENGEECTIENLFVEPRITNTPKDSSDESEIEKYTIEEIISGDKNFLLYGGKESGKTLLLDKMFIDSINLFNQIDKIPCLFKFSDLKDKGLKKSIREFAGISSREIDDFLNKNRVIVFIDDFNFNGQSSGTVSDIENMIEQHSKIQIVTVTTQHLENIIPLDYLKHNDIIDFNLGFIQDFNSSEIKQLTTKWFAGGKVDLKENMQKLIKSFTDFGLPKTPLSITMFLWIFEKQENRPINNSVLVEMFVENLLEKTNIVNIYSETFDFKNKLRFLSFIAKFMKDEGDSTLSYSVDYVELLNYVKSYLDGKFSGKPQLVLEDIIQRGILCSEDENNIRFKSAFFFHYFLALHFDYDESFKKEVFTDENFLNYIDEINYYTGLKRDDVDVLKFTMDKLEQVFKNYNADVTENFDRIDTVLEPVTNKDTLTYHISDESIKNKMDEEKLEEVYDDRLSTIPVQKKISSKEEIIEDASFHADKVLKIASIVFKNSEDVDDFELKKNAYNLIVTSSISFLMGYRDAIISYYNKHQKAPTNLPKNISFGLFIRMLPLIHQVVLFNWIGSKKIRPTLIDKINKDKNSVNISEFEKYMSVFIYSDIKGENYDKEIQEFVKGAKKKYIKDLSNLKIISYYHLRNNTERVDSLYLKLMAGIKEELGQIKKEKKGKFIQDQRNIKRKKG